jgi:phosphatidate cytidylyltransferase
VSGLAGTAECLAGVLTLGGVGALASGNREVIRKWRTWMVSAPLAAGCLWFGAPGAALLAAGLGVTGAVEYGRLAKLRAADSVLLAAVAVILPAVAWRMPADLGRALGCSRSRWSRSSAATPQPGRAGRRPGSSGRAGSRR